MTVLCANDADESLREIRDSSVCLECYTRLLGCHDKLAACMVMHAGTRRPRSLNRTRAQQGFHSPTPALMYHLPRGADAKAAAGLVYIDLCKFRVRRRFLALFGC